MPSKYQLAKAQELYDKGYSQQKIAKKLGIDERTFRNWKHKKLIVEPVFKKGGPIHEQPCKDTESTTPYIWTPITATDLLKARFTPQGVPSIIASLGIARKQNNTRAHRFLKGVLELSNRYPRMPESWRGVIAGFPIISEDIQAQSMKDVAQLVEELQPYLNKQTRREYHKRVAPIVVKLLAQCQAWIIDACITDPAKGFPLTIIPALKSKKGQKCGAIEAQDILMEGKWEYMIPEYLVNTPIEKTTAGMLYDIISRFPDPDRQKGKLIRNVQLSVILFTWCFTAPSDFLPPLPQIKRRNYIGDLHTEGEAGLYTKWSAEIDNRANEEEKQPWV